MKGTKGSDWIPPPSHCGPRFLYKSLVNCNCNSWLLLLLLASARPRCPPLLGRVKGVGVICVGKLRACDHSATLAGETVGMELHDRRRNRPELDRFSNGNGHYSPELSRECKRPRLYFGENMFPANPNYTSKAAANFDGIGDYSDPFSLRNLIEFLESGKYGSVTEDIESLCARRDEMLKLLCVNYPSCHDRINYYSSQHHITDTEGHDSAYGNISSVGGGSGAKYDNLPIIDIDSDDELGKIQGEIQPTTYSLSEATNLSSTPFMLKQYQDNAPETDPLQKLNMKKHILSSAQWNSSYLYQKVVLGNNSSVAESKEKYLRCSDSGELKDKICDNEKVEEDNVKDEFSSKLLIPNDVELIEETCKNSSDEDGLQDMWREMNLALECSKGTDLDNSVNIKNAESECEHSCVLKDDLGYVCQLCGVIQKSIEAIIDYQWKKETRSTRTYASEPRSGKATDEIDVSSFSGIGDSTHDFTCEVSIHPRHRKQMKPHQLEGFKFLVKNLVAENPGGCILAHAPGSGKTFLIISFIQSFLAKFPLAKPMVVLPKGILSTWKKEFQRWQIEDVPLFDLYLASNRAQQLEVLNNWLNQKSVLFLGYKQFSSILCEIATNTVEAECQEKLLKVPSLLILDEGHTPRNENTNVLYTLSKVHTPRKVVLSGTIFQNHVKEVFNILNLVRPKFLKTDDCRAIVRRILSKVQISGGSRKFVKMGTDAAFFDLVEETLQKDEDFKRKAAVINDLREMTCNVLHYYKGDFLEELPGLVDFTVILKLTDKQKNLIEGLKRLEKFKRISVGSAVYMHPELKDTSEKYTGEKGAYLLGDDKIDLIIDKINLKDGVKTRFFLKVLSLAESANEKVLVFSQYLLPLKFLERVLVTLRGWTLGKEMFIISGDSSPEDRETSMDKFNTSSDSRVLFGSIKACGEGISLVGASRIIILDVHLNPSVTRQAIGRAFRPGQLKKVYTYRLVAADSPEEQDHQTSFCKDLISKLWFEWSEFSGTHDFTMEEVETDSCGDMFIESPNIREDVKVLYRR